MAQALDDAPDMLIEHARQRLREERDAARHDEQGRRLARRLFVSAVLLALVALACFVVLPGIGISMPVQVPLLAFAAIAVGAVMTHRAEAPEADAPTSRVAADDNARPVGCCSGPGHMRCLKGK